MKLRTLTLPAALVLGAACSASPTAADSAGQLGSGNSASPSFGSGAGVASPEAASFTPPSAPAPGWWTTARAPTARRWARAADAGSSGCVPGPASLNGFDSHRDTEKQRNFSRGSSV